MFDLKDFKKHTGIGKKKCRNNMSWHVKSYKNKKHIN
jgi:hypothetical protein